MITTQVDHVMPRAAAQVEVTLSARTLNAFVLRVLVLTGKVVAYR